MKLIYTDPHSSGLYEMDCDFNSDEIDIMELLSAKDIDEDTCGGDVVYFMLISDKGAIRKGYLDFT